MRLLCLMPTYGRRKELLENSIQLFLNQDHPDKTLLIFDDLGTLSTTEGDFPNVMVMSTIKRTAGLGDKYNLMMNYSGGYDGIVVWDDDDVYLPHHLSTHAAILKHYLWSKPSKIISAYSQPPAIESADGRFHGSIAVRTDYIKQVGLWTTGKRCNYDQGTLARLQQDSLPGDPTMAAPISYVYRWQTSGGSHCSGMNDGDDWYDRYIPDSTSPIDRLVPQLDEDTATILHNMSIFNQ